MRAVVANYASRRIELVDDLRFAALESGDVRLRVLEVGVCGTDRELSAFSYGTPPSGSDRLVVGHESLALVTEVSPDIPAESHIHVGDLVVAMVRRPCEVAWCAPCRAGRQDFCVTGKFTERGIIGRDGFLVEETVDQLAYLQRVPAGLRDVAVLTEPLTIAEKAIAELARTVDRFPWLAGRPLAELDLRALVFGAGPVGLLGAMALRASGMEVTVYSREPQGSAKSKIAAAIGADYASAKDIAIADVGQKIGSIDVVYEAAGASRASFELLKQLGANGVFILTGVPGRKGPSPVDTDKLMRQLVLKNQMVLGTVNAGRDAYKSAVSRLDDFMSLWPDATRALITGRHSLDDAPAVIARKQTAIKDVIRL